MPWGGRGSRTRGGCAPCWTSPCAPCPAPTPPPRVADGGALAFHLEGDGGGRWSLHRADGRWVLREGDAERPLCIVRTDTDTAWRVLHHALSPDRARGRVTVEGDAALAEPFLDARAVMV